MAPTNSLFPSPSTTFTTTKKDKRLMKRSLLLSKIRKSSDKNTGSKKRRRPAKKLVTTLNSLGDALDDIVEQQAIVSKPANESSESTKPKSIKTTPGVNKRKEKILKEERERFGKNLAVLADAGGGIDKIQDTGLNVSNARWEALRKNLAARAGGG